MCPTCRNSEGRLLADSVEKLDSCRFGVGLAKMRPRRTAAIERYRQLLPKSLGATGESLRRRWASASAARCCRSRLPGTKGLALNCGCLLQGTSSSNKTLRTRYQVPGTEYQRNAECTAAAWSKALRTSYKAPSISNPERGFRNADSHQAVFWLRHRRSGGQTMSALLRKLGTFVAVVLACAASTLPPCGTIGGGE